MSSVNSSPDFEVLSTTSEGADGTLDVRDVSDVKEKKEKQIKSVAQVAVADIQFVPVAQQAITMPVEVFEALIQRVATLEKELKELKIDVTNRTLIKTVPVVVSATAISKGIERDTTSLSEQLGRRSITEEWTDTFPNDDPKDWGNYPHFSQSTPFSTDAGFRNPGNSTFVARSEKTGKDTYYNRSMSRNSNGDGFNRSRYDDDLSSRSWNGDRQKAWDRYDNDGSSRRAIAERDKVRTSTQNDWKTRNDREYRHREEYSDHEERYKNFSSRGSRYGASSPRQDQSPDSFDRRSFCGNGHPSNCVSNANNRRNYDDDEMSNSQYERTLQHLCVFCKGHHSPDLCPEVTHYRERRELLLLDGRCEICLSHHSTDRCSKRKIPCKHCDDSKDAELHHFSICPFKHY